MNSPTQHDPGHRLVSEFRKHLGAHEIAGSNAAPGFVDDCQAFCGLPVHGNPPEGVPWCACAFSKVCHDAGYPLAGGPSASVARLVQNAMAHGRWTPAGSHQLVPLPGWGFVLHNAQDNAEHVGMVTETLAHGLMGIAGNTGLADGTNPDGGYVGEHFIPSSIIRGYIHTW
jgi:hypothetical protein